MNETSEKGREGTAEGIVVELMPNAVVRVTLEGEHQFIAHLPSVQRGELCAPACRRPRPVALSFRVGHEDGFGIVS